MELGNEKLKLKQAVIGSQFRITNLSMQIIDEMTEDNMIGVSFAIANHLTRVNILEMKLKELKESKKRSTR